MNTFTVVHVALSLVGIVSGLIVLIGLMRSDRMERWTALFLSTTLLTSGTGFGFPYRGITPGVITGVLSLLILTVAIIARYHFRLRGIWRSIYVIGAVVALYLNCLVLVAQVFLHVSTLHAVAPRGSEPPVAITQGTLLILFLLGGILALRRFHPAHN
jgi:hypothetical protein